jgi:lipid II:glycine glycyltransferase (peptidoglycan interpeptide bridge formation enzyme)
MMNLKFLANIAKEISTHTQPLQQAVDNLSKQHQPLVETIRDLPKQLDDIRQSQSQSNLIKELSSKLDPLTQSIKAIKDGNSKQRQYSSQFLFFLFYLDLDQQTQNKDQTLMNIDKKLDQVLITPSDNNQDLEKALQPFSQMIKKLKDSTTRIYVNFLIYFYLRY